VIESVVGPTVDWLAATGAPNAVVLLFAFTSIREWSRAASRVVNRAVDRVASRPDSEPTE
jgi:hypothetical protein